MFFPGAEHGEHLAAQRTELGGCKLALTDAEIHFRLRGGLACPVEESVLVISFNNQVEVFGQPVHRIRKVVFLSCAFQKTLLQHDGSYPFATVLLAAYEAIEGGIAFSLWRELAHTETSVLLVVKRAAVEYAACSLRCGKVSVVAHHVGKRERIEFINCLVRNHFREF